MGSEIIYPIGIGLIWEIIIFVGLSLAYALIFRFRNTSVLCRTASRTILYVFVVMLLAPSILCAMATLMLVPAALTGAFQPSSDGFIGAGLAIGLDCIVVGAWRGLATLFRHLDRSPHRPTPT
jgi:uncharacterized membrane protein